VAGVTFSRLRDVLGKQGGDLLVSVLRQMSRSKVCRPHLPFLPLSSFPQARGESTGGVRTAQGGAYDLGCGRVRRSQVADRGSDCPNLPLFRGPRTLPQIDSILSTVSFRSLSSSNFIDRTAVKKPAEPCSSSTNQQSTCLTAALSIEARTLFLQVCNHRLRRRRPQHHRWGLESTTEKGRAVFSSAAVTKRT
jgi:hypothetical protein